MGGLLLGAEMFGGEEAAGAGAKMTMGDHLQALHEQAANQPKQEPLDLEGMAAQIRPLLYGK